MEWFRKLSTQSKTFIFVTTLLLASLIIIVYNFERYKTQRLKQTQVEFYQNIQVFYNHLLHDHESFYRYILQEVIYSPQIKDAFLRRDRERLLNLSNALWSRLKNKDKDSNLIHYHLPNGQSFLRIHEPLEHDDNISLLREMPRYVHQHHKMIHGFEKGIYKLAYRSFAPIFHKDKYIGAVEFGSQPDYIFEKLQEFQALGGLIFVKNSALDLYNEKISKLTLGEYTLQYSNLKNHHSIYQKLKAQNYNFQTCFILKSDDKIYNIYPLDIMDFKAQIVAKILVLEDVTSTYTILNNRFHQIIFFIVVLTVLLLLIIHVGFRSLIGKLDQKNKQLNKNKIDLQNKIKEQVTIISQKKALMRQQSKMAEMGNMIGAITHQWKQPLAIIASLIADLSIKLMMNNNIEDKNRVVKQYLDNIMLEVAFLNQTVDDFKNFLKPSKEKVEFSITAQIQSVERILKAILQKNNITINISKEIDDDRIEGYPTEFAQVILNLINNAKDAIITHNSNSTIDISIYQTHHNKIKITIQDYAGGIQEEYLNDIFKQYYTTKGNQGTGIGLSIVQEILKSMNGEISVTNYKGGARFTIEISKAHDPTV